MDEWWVVVHFLEQNEVEVVPSSWVKPTKCLWPVKWSKTKISNAVRQQLMPGEDWELHDCKILGKYSSFKQAHQKANKGLTCDILTSGNENEEGPQLHRRKTYSFSDDNSYPTPPNKLINSTEEIITHNNYISETTFNEFQKQIFRQINLINIKIDSVLNLLNSLTKVNEVQNTGQTVNVDINDVTSMFPLETKEDITNLETILEDKSKMNALVTHFARIGGHPVATIVRNIMQYCITNKNAQYYSWEGAKGKEVFKTLNLSKAIIEAVHFNKKTSDATDADIIVCIKKFLVRAKERYMKNTKTKE